MERQCGWAMVSWGRAAGCAQGGSWETPRVSSAKAEPHQPVLICLLLWVVSARPPFLLPFVRLLLPYGTLPSSLPLAPSLMCFSSHPFPSRRLSSPQRPATKAKLGPHCGVSPLPRTLPVCANPSLNPKNLLGAGISLRLPATHAFPTMLCQQPVAAREAWQEAG